MRGGTRGRERVGRGVRAGGMTGSSRNCRSRAEQQQKAATTARYLELDNPSAQLHCICCCGHAHSLRGVLLTEHCF